MDSKKHYEELMERVKVVKDRVRGVVHGQSNGVYLHGMSVAVRKGAIIAARSEPPLGLPVDLFQT